MKLCYKQGRNEGGKGGAIPRAPSHYGGAEKSQRCHKYFLQYSTFASERPQFRTWGCQTCFLARAAPNLVTPLVASERNFCKRNFRCGISLGVLCVVLSWGKTVCCFVSSAKQHCKLSAFILRHLVREGKQVIVIAQLFDCSTRFYLYVSLEVLITLALSSDTTTQEYATEAIAECLTVPTIQDQFVSIGGKCLSQIHSFLTSNSFIHWLVCPR